MSDTECKTRKINRWSTKLNLTNTCLFIPAHYNTGVCVCVCVCGCFVVVFLPFFTGVAFLDVCDAGALPPEGVVEVGLEAAGLAVVEVLGVAGLAAAGELLVVLAVGGRVEPVAGRDDDVVPVEGLKKQYKDEG